MELFLQLLFIPMSIPLHIFLLLVAHSMFLNAGSLPMVLTSNVSPPGVYSLRIVASTGGEHTIFYNITTESTQSKTSLTKTQAKHNL